MFGVFYLQSEYSMQNNIIPIRKLVENAKSGGYDFLALADNDNLHALLSFTNLCRKNNIRPVYGMKVTVNHDLGKTGFLLYAKNEAGYENLLTISRIIQTSKKIIDIEELILYEKGLIVISSGYDNSIDKELMKGNPEKASLDAAFYKKSFSSFYIGLSLQSFDYEIKCANSLVSIANEEKIKILPLNQTSYLKKEDKYILDYLIKINDEKSSLPEDLDLSFLNKEELYKRFNDYSFVFDNTEEILKKITFELKSFHFGLPLYKREDNVSSGKYLEALSAVGLKKRLENKKVDFKKYDIRLRYELSVINQMGYNDYFLIVYDFINYAKKNNIIVGPGRGTAASSLVAYSLGITEVDPIYYNLLFERFLNPERVSMPDIDTDFPDDKRDMVIEYVKNKYGINHIASIATFQTFGFKQSIRDIARVMKIEQNRLSGIISRIDKNTADESDDLSVKLIDVAKKIEGLPRHVGTHAAGIILSEADLTQYIPLQSGAYSFYQTQLEASDLERMGLLKIDFLGLKNLSIIDQVLKDIQKLNLKDIPLDDKKTFKIFQEAETIGIFQLESTGIRNVLRKMKPSEFNDIVAVLALYRPGPMENIDEYIERKNGKSFGYIHPLLEPILKETYGIIVYQEQIMQICVSFAGYSLAEADLLRRAVSKKDKESLDKEKENFIHKSLKLNHSKETAEVIYEYILKFANYGFNKSHSVSYALVAYQMAYLKANYYLCFMSVLMSSVIGNEALTLDYIKEVRKNGYDVISPDINESGFTYIIKNNQIYFPLLGIKGLGRDTLSKLLYEREKEIFKDYNDFKLRVSSFINKKILEQLINSSALDIFGLTHHTMLENNDISGIDLSLYIDDVILKQYPEYDLGILIENEKAAIGFNLKYNPLELYKDEIKSNKMSAIKDIKTGISDVIGFAIKKKEIKTKSGEKMCFITISDSANELELVVFPKKYQIFKELIDAKRIAVFRIKREKNSNGYSNILESVTLKEKK